MVVKTIFPDYSEFLAQGDNLAKEDEAWLRDHEKARREVAAIVNRVIEDYDIQAMIEFGCGTGWLGQMVPANVAYTGVDANLNCVGLAGERNRHPGALYFKGDLRTFDSGLEKPSVLEDLVVSFSFLKHFGLHEWEYIFARFLLFGRYAVFTLQVTDGEDEEDGTEYHHVWIGPKTLGEALKNHEVLYTNLRWHDPNSDKKDVLYVVKRKEA